MGDEGNSGWLEAAGGMEALKCIAPLLILLTASCGPSLHELAVRDGTVSSNAHAVIVSDLDATANSMYKIEQDQAVLFGGSKTDIKLRVATVRVQWAPAWAWIGLARIVHTRLAKLVVTGDRGSMELSMAELEGIETQIGWIISAAKKRIGEAQ